MRKLNAKFNTAFISEAGTLLQNKDYFAYAEMDDFACYVIADGVDDDLELESAEIAVASIIRQFSEQPSMKKREIKKWLETANQELLAASKTMRLKASLTVLVTDYTHMMFGLSGNTRLYLFREGALIYRSIDQSLSSNLLEDGKTSVDRIASHLERHNLYCYLGQPDGFRPEVSGRIKLADGDTITLLTRGIWENIDIGEMSDVIKEAKNPQDLIDNTEDLLLSRQPPNLDNYTIAAIFVDKTYQDPGLRKMLIKRILYASIPVLLIIVGLLIFYQVSEARKKDQLNVMSGHVTMARSLFEQGNYVRATEEYRAALSIAQKLKLKTEHDDLMRYYATTDLIVAGDTAFQQKNFVLAAEKYRAALDASYFADHIGEAYILKQKRLTGDYMEVTELIQTGDQKMEQKDYNGALKAYLEAKVTASRIYYSEGRKLAADKLTQLNEFTKEEGKKLNAQEAAVYEQQGDRMLQRGDYQGALAMLSIASGLYDQSGKSDKAANAQRKIAAVEDRMTTAEKVDEQGNMVQEALQYESEGDKLLAEKEDIDGALDQYNIALSLYEKSDKKDKIALMQMRIENLNERKRNTEKYNLQISAMDLEKQGDRLAKQKKWEEAKDLFCKAEQKYGQAGLSTNVVTVRKKIDNMDKKIK